MKKNDTESRKTKDDECHLDEGLIRTIPIKLCGINGCNILYNCSCFLCLDNSMLNFNVSFKKTIGVIVIINLALLN